MATVWESIVPQYQRLGESGAFCASGILDPYTQTPGLTGKATPERIKCAHVFGCAPSQRQSHIPDQVVACCTFETRREHRVVKSLQVV